ncbi:splicing factor CC1-like protein [Blastocystis sp. subtype 4]|uniref:splicing factor CC1-like protein n=1 Tax=Blastocystis sp. subtype 4 TaxID=944170 RepID=UPI000711CC04|nr:splicing factor CC1-like protein [Blastocystis sp. subtype 4]KNB43155.1 splicing factor CC1-like protein [Blastocystis sp. subtype 4]|eukprot:XP_014526598.1 splicing factor CC1-like protein [Blastocystis sp. subtype 4]
MSYQTQPPIQMPGVPTPSYPSNQIDRERRSRRDRSSDRRSRHSSSPSGDRKDRRRDAEPAAASNDDSQDSLTRDVRTVFVSDLQVKVDEKWLRYYFEQAGGVVSIKLIRDRYSGRSKGMGYIEMKTLEDASKALMLNGQKMCTKHKACNCSGFPMKVKRSEAEKNWSAMKEKAPPKIQPSTIYVCNLHPELSRRDIMDLFESIGDVDNVEMELDERKQFKGSAYVKFRRPEYASRAALKTDGMDVLGKKISVSIPQRQGRSWRLEDEEGQENIALDPQRRGLIMRHLADSKKDEELNQMMRQVNNPGQVQSGLGADGKPIIQGNASNCMVLRNMFTPALETEPTWDIDIQEDVKSECQKYGNVLHCFVDKNSDGNVYLMFGDLRSCRTAAQEMNGRWFNRRQIQVAYVPLGEYVSRFPDARRAASVAQATMANSVLIVC